MVEVRNFQPSTNFALLTVRLEAHEGEEKVVSLGDQFAMSFIGEFSGRPVIALDSHFAKDMRQMML